MRISYIFDGEQSKTFLFSRKYLVSLTVDATSTKPNIGVTPGIVVRVPAWALGLLAVPFGILEGQL